MNTEHKILHRALRRLAGWACWSFFAEVHLIGEENVPKDGPLIVAATHHNMMIDPAILSSYFPHRRILNYWTKATLFANPILKRILLSSGNIPVDRKSKDNRVLFRGTFECLASGEAVALFPEGTSYTEPCIRQVKDGAAWAALEFMKWAKENPSKVASHDVKVLPVGIVYTNKSKYRSAVIIEYGEPISMADYEEQFLSTVPGEARLAVKRLTRRIEENLVRFTINADDWDTLFAARMARDLLWEGRQIDLDNFIPVSQTIIDIFSTPEATPNITQVRNSLLSYYSLLESSKLTNDTLSALPLPQTLDPRRNVTLPSRLFTMSVLLRDTLGVLVRLPFFVLPLMVHLPIYIGSKLAARLAEDEEETQAQNKVVLGLLLLMMIYPAAFFFMWALLWYTPTGALISFTMVWLFAVYHVRMIDDVYTRSKRLMAAWRVLVGIWAPRKWDMSMAALKQYTVPLTPPENPWIDKPKKSSSTSAVANGSEATASNGEEQDKAGNGNGNSGRPGLVRADSQSRRKRPPTRRLIRHVLRARGEAVRSLSAFFASLESCPDKKLRASGHLAVAYGSFENGNGPEREGYRYAREVLGFLRERGGNLKSGGLKAHIEGDYWAGSAAALSSDTETWEEGVSSGSESSRSKERVELEWVAPHEE